jgi:hypothetical protein
MPSPGKVSIVPPVHEILRFSSLPCSPGPLANVMDVDKIAALSEASERVRDPSKSSTSPSHNGLDSSSCKTPVAEDKNLPSTSQLPSVVPGQEAIPSIPSIPSNVSPSALPQSSGVRPFSILAVLNVHIWAVTCNGNPRITRGTRERCYTQTHKPTSNHSLGCQPDSICPWRPVR